MPEAQPTAGLLHSEKREDCTSRYRTGSGARKHEPQGEAGKDEPRMNDRARVCSSHNAALDIALLPSGMEVD